MGIACCCQPNSVEACATFATEKRTLHMTGRHALAQSAVDSTVLARRCPLYP
jgi:hypothetical protein